MTHRGPFQPVPFCDSVKQSQEFWEGGCSKTGMAQHHESQQQQLRLGVAWSVPREMGGFSVPSAPPLLGALPAAGNDPHPPVTYCN